MKAAAGTVTNKKPVNQNSTLKRFRRQLPKHFFVWMGLAFLAVFAYAPMYGIIIAFKDYRFTDGIWGSAWVGLENYRVMFSNPMVWQAIRNTLTISALNLIVCFPAPIILALLINEIYNRTFKRVVQTISYLPYFVSWVIVYSLITSFLRGDGVINSVLLDLNLIREPIYFIQEINAFYPILLISDLWKGVGWGTIIYLSSISSVNPEVVEAAVMDGATRMQQVWHIILPSIRETIVVLFIFRVSGLLNTNFDQIYLLQNTVVMEVAETLETYVFKMGVGKGQYSFATAVGLLKSVVGFGLLQLANFVSNKLIGEGLF